MALNIDVLETSFQPLQNIKKDFSSAFYTNLLDDYPEVRPLFVHTKMDQQGNHLFDSLAFVVANLRNADLLEKTLRGLGTRHVKYGVLPKHYPLVGNSLIKTMASFAEDSWTSSVEEAWIEAYSAVTSLMLDGADYSQDVLELK